MSNRRYAKSISKRVHSPDTRAVKIRTEKGYSILKTVSVISIIGIQLVALLCFYLSFAIAFWWYLASSFILSLITSVYILSSDRNGLSKAVWILFLLLFFSFGYVLYWLSDERIFFRKARKKYQGIFKRSEDCLTQTERVNLSDEATVKDAEYLYRAGNFKAYMETRTKYFPSGAQFFDDVLKRIESAERFVFLEFYIVSDGVLLQRFFDLLSEKATAGVDVRLIYDDMGSHRTLSRKTRKKFKNAGIKILAFNRLLPLFSVAHNFRDHRKIIVVDGTTAYSGGCNLADEYVNEKRMYGYWKDAGIRLDGKACDTLTVTFLRQWEFLSSGREDYKNYLCDGNRYGNKSAVIPFADGLDYSYDICKNVFVNVISGAMDKVYIMTPYFIPDETITNLLANKALSGVDVRIVLPGIPDKNIVYSVSLNNAEKLIECGVKVYLMEDSFVHSKLILTENCAVVGSANMDLRSFYQQFECAVYTDDDKVLKEVEKDFLTTFEDSGLISAEDRKCYLLKNRIVVGFLRLFAPLM